MSFPITVCFSFTLYLIRNSVDVYGSHSHTESRSEAAAFLASQKRERGKDGYDNTLVTVNVGKNAIKVGRCD